MNIFVHDRIWHIGGAEKVLGDLVQGQLDKYPDGNTRIYTMYSNRSHIHMADRDIEIITALPRWIFGIFTRAEHSRIRGVSRIFDYRNLMFFYPILAWILRYKILRDISKYSSSSPKQDIRILISSFAWAKNIISHRYTQLAHISLYLHSPCMYIWTHYDYNIRKLPGFIKPFYRLATRYLRPLDLSHQDYDQIYTNSMYTQGLCRQIYHQESQVRYPRIDHIDMYDNLTDIQPLSEYADIDDRCKQGDYYIYIGRVIIFAKELDRVIKLFLDSGDRLLVIGSGPDMEYLQSISRGCDHIYRAGAIYDTQTKNYFISKSSGFVNIGVESFGLTTCEAMLCGTPVFANMKGGSAELVDDESGVLCDISSDDHIYTQRKVFITKKWDKKYISSHIRKCLDRYMNIGFFLKD